MTQKLLNRAEIGAFGQEMCGKRMSERVRRYRIRKSELRPDFFQPTLNNPRGQSFAACSQKQGLALVHFVRTFLPVSFHGVGYGRQKRYNPRFLPLTGYPHKILIVQIADIQGQGFRNTQSAAVEQGKDGLVAQAYPIGIVGILGVLRPGRLLENIESIVLKGGRCLSGGQTTATLRFFARRSRLRKVST